MPAIPQEIRWKTRCQCTDRGPAEAACATSVATEFRPGKVEFSANSLNLRISTQKKEADCQSWQKDRRKDRRRDRARARRVRAPVMRENISFLLVLHQPHALVSRHGPFVRATDGSPEPFSHRLAHHANRRSIELRTHMIPPEPLHGRQQWN